MPTSKINLVTGVNAERTPSLNEAAYQLSNLIRWDRSTGLPQKIGGWTRFYPVAIGSIVRALHAWEDLSSILHLGVGATASLSVITNGILNAITPRLLVTNPAVNVSTTINSTLVTIDDPGSDMTTYNVVVIETPIAIGGLVLQGAYSIVQILSSDIYQINAATAATSTVLDAGVVPQFTTVAGQSTVTVSLPNHGYSVGGTFPIVVPTTVGGITLSGFYTVNTVIDANTFTINAANLASSAAIVYMNGGNAQFDYYITIGPPVLSTGYGVGGYGLGGYGTGVVPPVAPGTPITATDWTLDNFGGSLLASPNNGPLFVWQANSGLGNAQMVASAPVASTGMFVSMPQEIVVAYGSSVLGIQDPLLINWSNAGDYTVWTSTVANFAGSFRLSRGSRIVGGMQGPQAALIWTDLAIWSMTFIGQPLVWGFLELATGCGLMSKFAATVLGTTVFWISQKGVFALPAGGSVTPVPCTVWDVIFQNLDLANIAKIRAGSNSQFGEVEWWFPTIGGNGENGIYVKFTPDISAWDYGAVSRSAWIDQSVFGGPIGADPTTTLIFQHETSNDGDGQVINAYFETGLWDMGSGEEMIFNDLVYPDMRFGMFGQTQSAAVQISFKYGNSPQGVIYQTPVYTMQAGSPAFLNVRFRGRVASMRIESNDIGSFWRLGALRVRSAPDGKL